MSDPLWLTYARADNDEGDFDYLVQELENAQVPTVYDKISLVPGRLLWPQIADRISSVTLSGWAYLITPNSLASPACREELNYALQRALGTKDKEFPLIGLLHKVSISDAPLALRIRLCINLADHDWIEQVRAGVSGTPPGRTAKHQEPFVVKTHQNYLGRLGQVAIEIRPRLRELTFWRIVFPTNGPQPVEWGAGPANGGGMHTVKRDALDGEYHDIGGGPMRFVGAGNQLTASTSAYAVFDGELPREILFGVANEANGTKAEWIIVYFRS